jgi:hypothetical protein
MSAPSHRSNCAAFVLAMARSPAELTRSGLGSVARRPTISVTVPVRPTWLPALVTEVSTGSVVADVSTAPVHRHRLRRSQSTAATTTPTQRRTAER